MIDDIPKKSIINQEIFFEEQEDNPEVKIYPSIISKKLINYLRLIRIIYPSRWIILLLK